MIGDDHPEKYTHVAHTSPSLHTRPDHSNVFDHYYYDDRVLQRDDQINTCTHMLTMHRYREKWRGVLQQIVQCAAFYWWFNSICFFNCLPFVRDDQCFTFFLTPPRVQTNELISLKDAALLVGVEGDEATLGLDIDDYLSGVCFLPKDLVLVHLCPASHEHALRSPNAIRCHNQVWFTCLPVYLPNRLACV